ncbi:MAG: DUF5134 domain-containing protein [Pseudonocardiaceae bacterium]
MAGVVWISWIFAVVFVGMALFFAVRLLTSRRDASWGGGSTDPSNNDPSNNDPSNNDPSADASHGVMSLGMAAMLWPWGDPVPGKPVPALYWQVLFGMAAAWFAVRLLRSGARSATIPQPGSGRGADLHHVLGNLAMVYMLVAVPAGHGAAHRTHVPGISAPGIALPALAWALLAYFLVFAVWLGAQLVEPVSTVAATSAGAAAPGGRPHGVVTSPHLLGSSRVVMGIGMSYMLVTML